MTVAASCQAQNDAEAGKFVVNTKYRPSGSTKPLVTLATSEVGEYWPLVRP